MLKIIEIVFLCITIIVIWTYILSGTYYRAHRLLPLIMGFIAVFQFNEVARQIFGYNYVFWRLNDMILVHECYLIVCYFEDYLELRVKRFVHWILGAAIAITDYILFTASMTEPIYRIGVLSCFLLCALSVVILQVRATFQQSYSRREGKVNLLIASALAVPGVVVFYDCIVNVVSGAQLFIALEISLVIIWYLVISGQIVDTRIILNNSVFKNSEIPTMLYDTDYYLITANTVAKKILSDKGYDYENMKREDYRRLASAISERADGQEEVIGDSIYRWQITPVDHKDKIRGYISQLVDISQQKEETRQMEKLKEAAEERSKMKAQFLAMQSHELRSPLQAIIGISQILSAKKEISPQDRRLAQHINSSGNTLLKIVNSILDFSKLESGHFQLSERPYDFLAMLMELAQMSLVNLDKKPILFSIEVQSFYPSVPIGDELCVKEMIQNILSNAIKFTSEGEIRCNIEFTEPENGSVVMTCIVKDTGPGMTQDQQEHIFDDYASFANQSAKEGTGLGLSLVAQMAKMMKGGAWAESDGVSGSSIGFTVIQGVAENSENKPPTTIDQYNFKGTKKAEGTKVYPSYCYPDAKVLFADDMKINRRILKELISPWKFTIEEAQDGEEAVEMVKNNHYDLIILDLRMPKMDGDEAAEIISGICDTPLVLLSANLFDNTKDQYLAKGFNAVLSKPIDMREVKNVLETYLPEDLKVAAEDVSKDADKENFKSLESKYKTLQTFRNELHEAGLDIQKTYMLDLALFQTKVHGIKGAARQLGYVYIADKSEIMEMAAKAEHTPYIERFINEYADELLASVDDIDTDLERLELEMKKSNTRKAGKLSASKEEVEKLFMEMKEGFETYNYSKIDNAARNLNALALVESERAFLEECTKALEDFDYELGVKLFSTRNNALELEQLR